MLFTEVLNTIPYYVQKNKRPLRFLVSAGLTFAVVGSVGISSFYLGRIMTHTGLQCPLAIDIEPFTSPQTTSLYVSEKTETKIQPQKTEVSIGGGAGGVVVSKNGTKYHFPWCAGAGQIKEENKVWYASEKDAQSAGYTKAGNCQ
ncbi:MAG: hypothetical protein NUW02_02000 [Candidatus Campbellbacteria bacterium]|nr:hypothetical protein [Candidatus Campbellbacteria bacterium]